MISIRHCLGRRVILSATWVAWLLMMWTGSSPGADEAWRDPDVRFRDVNDAIAKDDFKTAQELLTELRNSAKKLKDSEMQFEVAERGKEVTELSREFNRVSAHIETLKSHPSDAKAALAVGRYECVAKGNWKKGLPLLALGDDAKFAALAYADQKHPDQIDQQMEVANGWWKQAQSTTNANERLAYQLRARRWMLRARPNAGYTVQADIDQRLKSLTFTPDRIVVWNTHNGSAKDRGAKAIVVTWLLQGKPIGRQAVAIAWNADEAAYVVLRPKPVRIDEIRVEITQHQGLGGGLGEVEVLVGQENIALGCTPRVDAVWERDKRFDAEKLVDRDTSGDTGFWLTENGRNGWASIPLASFPPTSK